MKKLGFGTRNATPLTPAIRAGNTLYVSGQVPRRADGTIPDGIEAQTRLVLDKIKNLVEEAGGTLEDVVKTTVFLTDRADFAGMNRVYAEYFTEVPPARSTIACGLMIDILVEIECIAQIG
jgi:reactive intermediate/imine deaminase